MVGSPHPMTWTIGTTSYGFRYQLLDEREAPPLSALVRQARAAGLEAFRSARMPVPFARRTRSGAMPCEPPKTRAWPSMSGA